MFNFVVRRLGFLKHIPVLPALFDHWIKIWTHLRHPEISDFIDDLKSELKNWPGISFSRHEYGGLQFDYHGKEIGHIHSNGLLDILFSKNIKAELMKEGRIMDHHVLPGTGWISFYIRTKNDVPYAIGLLKRSLEKLKEKNKPGNIS